MARLPTFIIAGAMRCGTTSLNGYLREHPDVAMSQPKEVHFFDHNFDRGVDWYETHFAEANDAIAIGEATPDYLYHPHAIERISATVPDVKLVVLLRNPVDRAYSHYWHNRSRGRETLGFPEALAAERDRLRSGEAARAFYSYVDRGRYRDQLERVYRWIPPEQVLVHTFEDLVSRPDVVFADVCRFIGVDSGFRPPSLGSVINGYVEFRSRGLRNAAKRLGPGLRRIVGKLNEKPAAGYPPMTPDMRHHLEDLFDGANEGLTDLVGSTPVSWS